MWESCVAFRDPIEAYAVTAEQCQHVEYDHRSKDRLAGGLARRLAEADQSETAVNRRRHAQFAFNATTGAEHPPIRTALTQR
ncbi:MAG: hypothetical protein A2V70_05955 [Planctomycetes bacterium RBG_13_63_9]|nr:MAG: hypothetical protein A2V70_05955 [Planctomycetes bacterium RBG_13_63_9]